MWEHKKTFVFRVATTASETCSGSIIPSTLATPSGSLAVIAVQTA